MNLKKLDEEDFYEIWPMYADIETILEINIWDETATQIKTIDDLTLIVFHELISKKNKIN